LLENYKKVGGDSTAFKQAMCFLKEKGNTKFKSYGHGYKDGIKIENQRYVTIQDLTKSSAQKRLFILDRQTGTVEAFHTGHGEGKDHKEKEKSTLNPKEIAQHFGNEIDSNLTPTGFFITGDTYNTSRKDASWKVGMRLHGVQKDINHNAFIRGIVLHEDSYVTSGATTHTDDPLVLDGTASGRSSGCVTINPDHAEDIMAKLASGKESEGLYRGGTLFYNYSPNEKGKGEKYCGDSFVEEIE